MSTENKGQTTVRSGGLGFASVLTIVFIILKLTHVIDWAWIWVVSPLWISVGIGLVFFALVVILAAIVATLKR
jgi:hypothetical protein